MDTAPATAVADQVRRLVDRQELADLVSRLGAWLDGGAAGDPRRIFTDDVEVETPGGTAVGVDQVAGQARHVHRGFATHHISANVLCEFDGEGAAIHARQIATFAGPDSTRPSSAVAEVYDLRAVRRVDGWRLSKVVAKPVWQATDPSSSPQ